jgi:hypothetical protein
MAIRRPPRRGELAATTVLYTAASEAVHVIGRNTLGAKTKVRGRAHTEAIYQACHSLPQVLVW